MSDDWDKAMRRLSKQRQREIRVPLRKRLWARLLGRSAPLPKLEKTPGPPIRSPEDTGGLMVSWRKTPPQEPGSD